MASRIQANGTAEKVKAQKVAPITPEAFLKGAKPLTVTVNGMPMIAMVKQFSTGSFGWYLTGKTVVEVDGVSLPVQVGGSFTVIGSKPEDK